MLEIKDGPMGRIYTTGRKRISEGQFRRAANRVGAKFLWTQKSGEVSEWRKW